MKKKNGLAILIIGLVCLSLTHGCTRNSKKEKETSSDPEMSQDFEAAPEEGVGMEEEMPLEDQDE